MSKPTHTTQVANALEYYQYPSANGPQSIRGIAKYFGINETTLRRAIKNGVPSHSGPTTILTKEEEEQLVGYCLNMQRLGFGLTKSSINYTVLEMIHHTSRKYPFTDSGPGQAWWKRFLHDHPNISFRKPQALTAARAQKGNPTIINDHFTKLEDIIHKYKLTAVQIWNMDETGFNITGRLQKVLAKKNARQVHKLAPGNSNEHISVCPTISAAGIFIPPLFIYKGKRVINNLLEGAPPGTVMGFTEKGYMEEKLFRQYLEHFIQSVPPTRPMLLILDGYSSHISLQNIDLCRKNHILLYALPSNTTHILQPCEIPFRKLKDEYDRASERHRNNNNGALVTKYIFAKIVGEAYMETYTTQAILNAFKSTGIWPIDRTVIHQSRLEMSLVTERSEERLTKSKVISKEPGEGLRRSKRLEKKLENSDKNNKNDGENGSEIDGEIGGEIGSEIGGEIGGKIGGEIDGENGSEIDGENGNNKNDKLNSKLGKLSEIEFLRLENKKLQSENTKLKEEIDVLKHPGTSDPRQALRYLVPPAKPITGNIEQKRRKTFQFSTLITDDETRNRFLDVEKAEHQRKEDIQQRKVEREKKREERELEKEQKKNEREKKKKEQQDKKNKK
jgi:hypothetical protein